MRWFEKPPLGRGVVSYVRGTSPLEVSASVLCRARGMWRKEHLSGHSCVFSSGNHMGREMIARDSGVSSEHCGCRKAGGV